MSTYLAPNYTPPLPEYETTVPLELMSKAAVWKQNRYDTNRQDIQDQLDKLGNVPIIKDSDRELIASKTQDIVTKMNEFGGLDTGDTRVYNQLLGYTAGLQNDEEVYKRIAANTAANTQLKKIQKAKDENPDEYSPDNEHVFMKQFNSWMSDPNKKTFNATYTPYYNPKDEYNVIIDDVTKNPDIRFRTNADGSRSPLSDIEIKEVTAQKIYEALQGRLSDRAKAQMAIEHEASLDKPQFGVQSALAEVTGQMNYFNSEINRFKDQLPELSKDRKQYEATKAAIAGLEKERDNVNAMRTNLLYNGDASQYYTYPKFISDKLMDVGKSFAYKQEDVSKTFMEDYKFRHRLQLEGLRQSNKLALKKSLEEPTAINTFQNHHQDLFVKGKAEFEPRQVFKMQNTAGKPYQDGSMDVVLGNKPQYLDIVPMTKDLGLDVPEKMIQGSGAFLSMLSKWQDTPEGYRNIKYSSHNIDNIFGNATYNKKEPKSSDEFIDYLKNTNKIEKGEVVGTMLDDFKNRYGFDPSNSVEFANVRALANNPKVVEAIGKTTKVLEKMALKGSVNMIPQDGFNTHTGSDGKPYNRFFAQIPKRELERALEKDGGDIDVLIKSNIIKGTGKFMRKKDGKEDKDAGEIYQIPITLPVTKDMGLSNAEFVHNEDVLKKHAGVYDKDYGSKNALMSYTKEVINIPEKTLGDAAKANLDALQRAGKLSAIKVEQFKKIIDEDVASVQNANSDIIIYKKAKLKALSQEDPNKMLEAFNFVERTAAPLTITTRPTDYMSQDYNDEE